MIQGHAQGIDGFELEPAFTGVQFTCGENLKMMPSKRCNPIQLQKVAWTCIFY